MYDRVIRQIAVEAEVITRSLHEVDGQKLFSDGDDTFEVFFPLQLVY